MQPRILIVEDEVIVARTIASQLTQFGYQVVDTASSGAAAIEKAIRNQPDLVLMDVMLKGEMDGITAASEIGARLDVPIVFLTAYADENTLQRAKNTLPLGYVVKPFSPIELRVAVELALFKHRMEQELRANHEYLSTLLRSMNDAVIATDEQGQITFMNPKAETLTGWREVDAFGKDATEVLQLVDEATNLPVDHPVTQVLQTQEVASLQESTTLVQRNGDRIPIGDSASPLRRQPGQISGVVVVFWDMSAYRRSELLQQALHKEQELNQTQSQFAAMVSYELHHPLAAIETAIKRLQAEDLPEATKEVHVQQIRASVAQINQLIANVSLIGQIEVGQLQPVPVRLELQKFCQDLISEFSFNFSVCNPIQFTHPAQSLETWMDENLLRCILTNLLINAIKSSPDNGTVQLNLGYDLEQQTVTLQVQDEGTDISETEQADLSDFSDQTSNIEPKLGLAIVERCVDVHQGEFYVTRKMGAGTIVTVTLPLLLPPEVH